MGELAVVISSIILRGHTFTKQNHILYNTIIGEGFRKYPFHYFIMRTHSKVAHHRWWIRLGFGIAENLSP